MRRILWRSFLLLLTCMILYMACDDSSVARRGNNPPVIEEILANPESMLVNTLCTLQVVASDADGDSLRYQWSAAQGTFTTGTEDTIVTWQAPGIPGAYTVTVAVDDGDSTVTGDKNLTVTSPTELTVTPDTLQFDAGINTLFMTIENTGTGAMNYQLSKTADWLTLSKDAGTLTAQRREGKTVEPAVSSEQITVSVNRAGLDPGDYTDMISVTSDGGTAQVAVKMEVPEGPTLSVSETALDFGTDQNQRTFNVSNTGEGTLNWQATASEAWITGVTPANGNCGAGESDQVTVTVDRAGLDNNTYTGTVTVTSPEAGSATVNVQMEVNVEYHPQLSVTPLDLDFGSNGTEQTLQITNTGDGTLNWNIGATEGWLSCNPTSGSTTTEIDEVTVTVDRTGLTAGAYDDIIPFTSNDGTADVNVDMTVPGPGLNEDFSGDLSGWQETDWVNAWIDDGAAHIVGTKDGYYGIIEYPISPPMSTEYTVKAKMGRMTAATYTGDHYGLLVHVNDTGAMAITHFMFAICPDNNVYNYLILCFIQGSGWYLIDEDSQGYFSHISRTVGEWNEISWNFRTDGRINIRLGNELFFNSDLVYIMKSKWGIDITTDLVGAGFATNWNLEAMCDYIKVEPGPYSAGSASPRMQTKMVPNIINLPSIPRDVSEMRRLSDLYPELKKK